MILESQGKATEVQLSDIDVRLSLKLDNKDTSGKSSSTATLNNGTKPKKLAVNGTLSMDNSELLTEYIRLAESIDSDGQRTVYTISETTADSADIREVIFTDQFDVRKRSGLLAWQINFTLLEFKSVPEIKEQRTQTGVVESAKSDSVSGSEIQSDVSEGSSAAPNIEEHGTMFKLLKGLDNFLAPDDSE